MSAPSKYPVNVLRDACDRSQNWINVHVEKIANRANKISNSKEGYSKIRPKIFPKGLSTFKNDNNNDFDEEVCDNFLKNPRARVHSVDVIDLKVREALRQQFNDNMYINFEPKDLNDLPELDENKNNKAEKKTKEALLSNSNIELKVIDAYATPKRFEKVGDWKLKNKQEKVYVKSTDSDDNDIKIIPSVLLTYQTKFTKISDPTRRCSFQENHLELWESIRSLNASNV